MKKSILLAALFVAATSFVFAQNTTENGKKTEDKNAKFHGTVMSKPNKVDYGFYYGYGLPSLAHTVGLVLDINCKDNNYRTRIAAEALQRFWNADGVKNAGVGFAVSVHAQYLLPIAGGFYFYPSVGIRGEIHNANNWVRDYYKKHEELGNPDPNEKWGPGTWGIGADFGGGFEYQFCPYVALFAEGRYSVLYNTNFRWQANLGLTFHFGQGHRKTVDE